jgi:hypothetical protein
MDKHSIDQLFEDKLKNWEKKPSPDLWTQLATELDNPKKNKKGFLMFLSQPHTWGVAAAILLITGFSVLAFRNELFYSFNKQTSQLSNPYYQYNKGMEHLISPNDDIQSEPKTEQKVLAAKTNLDDTNRTTRKQIVEPTEEKTIDSQDAIAFEEEEEKEEEVIKPTAKEEKKHKIVVKVKLSKNGKKGQNLASEGKPKSKAAKFFAALSDMATGDDTDLQDLGLRKKNTN